MGHKLKVSQCCVVLVAIFFDIANATTTSTKTKGEFQLKPREVKEKKRESLVRLGECE